MSAQDTRGLTIHGSIVYDLLNVASAFGVLDEVVSMVRDITGRKRSGRRKSGSVRGSWMNVTGV